MAFSAMAQKEKFIEQLNRMSELYRSSTEYSVAIVTKNVLKEGQDFGIPLKTEAEYIKTADKVYSNYEGLELFLSPEVSLHVDGINKRISIDDAVELSDLEQWKPVGEDLLSSEMNVVYEQKGSKQVFIHQINTPGIEKIVYEFSGKGVLTHMTYFYQGEENPLLRSEIELTTTFSAPKDQTKLEVSNYLKRNKQEGFVPVEKYSDYEFINSIDHE